MLVLRTSSFKWKKNRYHFNVSLPTNAPNSGEEDNHDGTHDVRGVHDAHGVHSDGRGVHGDRNDAVRNDESKVDGDARSDDVHDDHHGVHNDARGDRGVHNGVVRNDGHNDGMDDGSHDDADSVRDALSRYIHGDHIHGGVRGHSVHDVRDDGRSDVVRGVRGVRDVGDGI